LKSLFSDYDIGEKKEKKTYNKEFTKDDIVEEIKRQISVPDLLSEYGVDTTKNPTTCPLHSSKGGKCLSFKEDLWHCFHCEEEGDIFNLHMLKNNSDFLAAKTMFATQLGLKIKNKKKNNKKKKTEEEKPKRTSSHVDEENKIMYEQIKKNGVSKFCVYNFKSNKIEYSREIFINGETYLPNIGEELDKGVVLLAEDIEEYNDDDELDEEIKTFIYKWLDVDPEYYQFCIWNIKRSWVFQKFFSLNYLRALGDFSTGKSRFLQTLAHLHYKPIFASGGTTAAPIFRIIDKWRGTLVIDEADFKFTDETQDIIKIINLGYEKGNFILRCDQNDASKINTFNPFCPKIIATRKLFVDKATESRCFTQQMTGTDRDDIPVVYNTSFFEDSKKLRNKLLLWRFRNYFKIDIEREYNMSEKLMGVEPRIRQISYSLLPLFFHNEKQMELFENFLLKKQSDLIDERINSWDGQIVKAIYDLIQDKWDSISNKDIIEKGNLLDFKGFPLKPRALSGRLKSLGFGKTIMKRTVTKIKRCIPLDAKHLKKLFTRYGFSVNDVTVVDDVTETPQSNNYSNKNGPEGSPIEPLQSLHSYKICNVKQLKEFVKEKKKIEIQKLLQYCESPVWAEERIKDMMKEGELFENPKGFINII